MHTEDGVKGIIYARRQPEETDLTRGAHQQPGLGYAGHASPNGGNSALHASDRPSHARSVRRPHEKIHQHAGSSWHLRKHRDSPNAIPGDHVAMLGGLDSISEHEYLAYFDRSS